MINTGKHTEGGNTKTPSKDMRSRKWCFTLNNYKVEDFKTLEQLFIDKKWNYIIGKEKGNSGTPHLQGYFDAKNAVKFSYLKKINNNWHLEKAKGNRRDNYRYCSKEGDFVSNIDLPITQDEIKQQIIDTEYKNVIWREWQQEVLDILDNKVDKRKIHWRWESEGDCGKSYLAKYLALTRNVIICSGKKNDIFNQVCESVKAGKVPKIILLDLPRTSMDYVNYDALEQLKNGFLYSGKYEGGQVFFPIPHVIAFANEEPDWDSMSKDRWDCKEI